MAEDFQAEGPPGFDVTVVDPGDRTPQTPVANAVFEIARAGFEDGIEASEVATQVVDAIRADQFRILTHPESRQQPVEHMQRAADGVNPTL